MALYTTVQKEVIAFILAVVPYVNNLTENRFDLHCFFHIIREEVGYFCQIWDRRMLLSIGQCLHFFKLGLNVNPMSFLRNSGSGDIFEREKIPHGFFFQAYFFVSGVRHLNCCMQSYIIGMLRDKIKKYKNHPTTCFFRGGGFYPPPLVYRELNMPREIGLKKKGIVRGIQLLDQILSCNNLDVYFNDQENRKDLVYSIS